jgi:Concanavalin A-like lectin/glucanases superfamily
MAQRLILLLAIVLLVLAAVALPAFAAPDALQMDGGDGDHLGGAGGNFSAAVQWLSAWFYISTANANRYLILALDNSQFDGWYVRLSTSGTLVECNTLHTGTPQTASTGSTLTTAKWYNVHLVRNGSVISVYVGDENAAPSGVDCTVTDAGLPAQTGNYGVGFGGSGGAGTSLNGRITSWRHFTRAPSLADVQAEWASIGTAVSTTHLYSNNAVTGADVGFGNTGGTPGYTWKGQGGGRTTATGGGPVISPTGRKH